MNDASSWELELGGDHITLGRPYFNQVFCNTPLEILL